MDLRTPSVVTPGPAVAAWLAVLVLTAASGILAGPATAAGPVPASPPAEAALGGRLFADPRLSPDGRFSCATCHRPDALFASPGVARSPGRDGRPLAVNTPSLVGLERHGPYGHDGGGATLEAQIAGALLARNEIANPSLQALGERLADDPVIAAGLAGAAGDRPAGEGVVAALAAFVRTLAPGEAPFDRWRRGDREALTPAARRGLALFRGAAGCAACHRLDGARPSFRDGRFHDTGIAARRWRRPLAAGADVSAGRMNVTGRPADRFRVGTPGLRTAASTPPYMHDGSLRTLADVVRYYAAGGARHDGLSPLLSPFPVDAGDVADLVAFLVSLDAAAALRAGPAE